MHRNHCRNGGERDGFTTKIRGDGFNGTVDTTWVADALTTSGKSSGGVPCVATLRKSETTAAKVTLIVAENSGKHYSTGRTIRGKSELSASEAAAA
jgi:hypothetical protein